MKHSVWVLALLLVSPNVLAQSSGTAVAVETQKNQATSPSGAAATMGAAVQSNDRTPANVTGAAAPPDSATQTSTGTAQGSSVLDAISKKVALSYFGVFRGPGLGKLDSTFQPTVYGATDRTNTQSLESYITTGYKINSDVTAGVITHFFYSPFTNVAGTNSELQMWDPLLVIGKKNLVNQGGLNISGKLTAQLPATTEDILRSQHMATGLSPTFNISYDIPNSKWNVSLYTYVTAYIPTTTAVPGFTSYKIYAAPNCTYQFSEKVGFTVWVDALQLTRNQGTGFISGMKNYTPDVEPGIAWEFVKGFTFNPMINIYPWHASLASSSIQAVITGAVF